MEEIVKILKIQAEDGERTVKSLKQEINDLRDALLNLDKNSEEYDKTLDRLIDDEKELTSVMKAGKNEVKAAEGSYNALQNEMTALRKVWKETADEAKRNEIGARINEINTQLKDLDATIGNNQRKVGSYEEALKTLNGVFASQRQELAALKQVMDNVDPSTEAYAQAFQRAAEITHNLSERQEQLKYSSADIGDQLNNIRGIASSMVAGFSAVNAAMGLFGEKNEDVAKAMLKVQQLMAIVQGLQGMDGLIKRTKGLSDAFKVWTKSTKAQTVATQAQTVATKGEIVATEGATVAQKGLNAAMKANPIGFVIGLIASLVGILSVLSGRLKKNSEAAQKWGKIWDKTRAILSGVANVIVQRVLAPLKELWNVATTLFAAMSKAVEGDWKGAVEEMANGAKNAVEIYKDSYDIIGNYKEAYNKTSEKLEKERLEKEAQMRAEARVKELEEQIKDNDAKLDSDWKYTEEGQKIYTEYFDLLMGMYSKDSEEYKEAQRDKWSYERDLNDKREKEEEERKKREEERRKARIKAAEDENKKLEQQYNSYISLINSNNASSGYLDWLNKYKTALNEFVAGMEAVKKKTKDESFITILNDQIEQTNKQIKYLPTEIEALITDLDKLIMTSSAQEIKEGIRYGLGNKELADEIRGLSDENARAFWDEFATSILEQGKSDELNAAILAVGSQIQKRRIEKTFEVLERESENNAEKILQNLNDATIKVFENKLFPTVEKEVQNLQFDLDKQTLEIDFQINFGNGDLEKLEMNKIEMVYQSTTEQLKKQLEAYQQVISFVEANGLIPSEEYEIAKKKIEELNLAIQKATDERYQNIAEVKDRYFKEELAETQQHYEDLMHIVENTYMKENAKGGSNKSDFGNWWSKLTPEDPNRLKEQMDQLYNIQKQGLEDQKQLWEERLADENLTRDQRIEAETALAQIQMDLADATLEHDIAVNEQRAEAVQQYVDIVNDSVQAIGDLFGSLADVYEADIDAKVKAGEMAEEEAEKEYKRVQAIQIAETVLNTIAGSVGAFLQAMKAYKAPFGAIIGGVAAASAAAAGAASIMKLKSTNPYSNNANSSMGVSNVAASAPTTDVIPQYTVNTTHQEDTDYLRNSIMDGMASTQLYVSVTDINDVQSRVKTTDKEASF